MIEVIWIVEGYCRNYEYLQNTIIIIVKRKDKERQKNERRTEKKRRDKRIEYLSPEHAKGIDLLLRLVVWNIRDIKSKKNII